MVPGAYNLHAHKLSYTDRRCESTPAHSGDVDRIWNNALDMADIRHHGRFQRSCDHSQELLRTSSCIVGESLVQCT